MSSCCSPVADATAQQFGDERARKDLAAYRKNGPGSTTRGLLEGLTAGGPLEGTLLDIGSGIGALTNELLGAGLSTATCVDLSPSFLAIAKQEAARRGNAERMSWYQGDFVLLAPSLPPADVVVLDRVVCCYPAFSPLLSQAAGRSRRFLALSYPRDRWYVRVVLRIENLVRRLRGNGFQAFVHPVTAMEALLRSRGFTRASRSVTLAWSMDVYRRDPV